MADQVAVGESSSSAAAAAAAQQAQDAETAQNTTGGHAQQPAQVPPATYSQNPRAYGQAYQSYHQYGQPQQQQAAQAAAHGQNQTQGQATAQDQQGQPVYQYPRYYGYAPQHTQPGPPGQVTEGRSWMVSKMVMHVIGIIFSLIALGLGISLVERDSTLVAIICPVPALCILWSGPELIIRRAHKFESGIHPGGHVAACLIIWLAAVIVGILGVMLGVLYSDGSDWCDTRYVPGEGYVEVDCDTSWDGIQQRFLAASVFICLLGVDYFALFVMACVDTARRNAAARRVVMVVNPVTYWGPPAQGWMPLQQQQQQQQQQSPPPAQNQGQAQHLAAPQPAAVHGWQQHQHQQQGIPLQDRTPSPATPYATPMEQVNNEKASTSQQAGNAGIREFYGGANSGGM